ncbi:hypothetical protein BB558_001775 [Smittium angustum]|uniref:Uncharacterized protein n=1 Tax=Smittium angustum TaxID=133377 RepID=A0A2U1J541_SMIAN|nr:hypothetical protein BB558_003753 [Smittium angustum]PWA02091.1 hypothetical protein BB558_001775 [Smittium angustum]
MKIEIRNLSGKSTKILIQDDKLEEKYPDTGDNTSLGIQIPSSTIKKIESKKD